MSYIEWQCYVVVFGYDQILQNIVQNYVIPKLETNVTDKCITKFSNVVTDTRY